MDLDDDPHGFRALAAKAGRGLVIAIWVVRQLVRTAWDIARGPLIGVLNVLAALIILFEEWGWKPLQELLARLSKYGMVAALERWIAGLPPYAALLAFGLPVAVLLPFKFLALFLLAGGHLLSAAAVFIAAKLAGTALLAHVFTLTKPALMEIEWFAAAYNIFQPWKEALFARIRASRTWRYGRMIKTRVRLEAAQAWARWRPKLLPVAASLRERVAAALRDIRVWFTGS